MTLEQSILDAVRALSSEQQEELLKFAGALRAREDNRAPRENGYGMLAHLGFRVSPEEIDEARREIWGDFPRDDI